MGNLISLENIPLAALLLDAVCEACNEPACHLLACEREEIVGHSLVDFFPPRQPDGRESALEFKRFVEEVKSGLPQSFRWQLRPRDGRLIEVDIALKGIETKGKSVVLVCMHDLVANEPVAALSESEKHYLALDEISPVGIFHTDAIGNFRYVNERWCEITGFAREEALKKGLSWGLYAEDRERVLKEWCDATGMNLPFTSEYRIQHADGTISWVYSQIVIDRDPGGKLTGYFGTITDLTERKKIEDALLERNEFIETILDNLPIGLCVLSVLSQRDKSGRHILQNIPDREIEVQYINNKMEEIVGWPKEVIENIGDYWEQLIPEPTYRQAVRRMVRSEVVTGDPDKLSWEYQITKRSGEKAEVLDIGIPMIEKNLWISTLQDVTERKRAEDEIRQLNRDLEARVLARTRELELANREMEAFTYSVSHDLRAPLRAIDGFSEALLEDYADKLDEEGKTYLRYLQDGSRDMSELIDGLLKLSRSTRGELLKERIDLSAMVEAVVIKLRQAEPQQQVDARVATEMAADADPRLLKVVFENLLGNAWKYSSHKAVARIEVGCKEQDGETVYFVKDSGAGFDMAFEDKLFQPFQRLHRADEFSGTGIGLATVERIISRHGGKIWAEATVGEGANFYFTLGEEGRNHG